MQSDGTSHRSEQSGGHSLSTMIDLWVGAAFVVAMAVCIAVEYVRNPDVPLAQLLSHHVLELLLFGLILWGISWLVLRVILIEPIRKIYEGLYRIGGGDHSPLVIKTGVHEIREIVEAINIMLWRMEQDVDRKAVNHAREKVVDIREYINDCEGIDRDKLSQILDQVSALDRKLHQIGLAGAIKEETRKKKHWGFPDQN
jgi:methyl-accepting chemotaxis protein